MLVRLFTVVLLGLSVSACAASAPDDLLDFPVPPGQAAPPASPLLGYNLDTRIQLLASNPVTSAIVEASIPGLLEDSNYPLFKGMSLRTVASLSGGRITANALQTIAEKLKSVPVAALN